MIRLLVHTLGDIAVKILILIVMTNLLFRYFQGQPFEWAALLDLAALPDKMLVVAETIWGLLREEFAYLLGK